MSYLQQVRCSSLMMSPQNLTSKTLNYILKNSFLWATLSLKMVTKTVLIVNSSRKNPEQESLCWVYWTTGKVHLNTVIQHSENKNATLPFQLSNLTEPQSLLGEIAKQMSGELTSVEVIAYVEALSRSASTLTAAEKDYSVKPSAINSTLSVSFVYDCCFSVNSLELCLKSSLCFELV